ncbi:GMC oxidoreductase [Novosphingobium sp. B-7]|uniref:GMC oxidoreductase n=1 Tax=Novosphingobium sp. B-7 TaxID=1298855 RepID=UPI001ED9B073|nr:GMC oxidoreductase [Novosphingobium sp. B-7]
MHRTICVVGSGPAGLALATDLSRRGISVLLLESGGVNADPRVQELSAGTLVNPVRHDDLMVASARRLGGASNLWGGRSMPYDPVDFIDRPWVDARWPISYAELMRWFPAAAATTHSGGAVYTGEQLASAAVDRQFDADGIERGVNIQQAQVIHAEAIARDPLLDIRTHATVVGIDFAENGCVTAIDVAHTLNGARARLRVDHLVVAAGGLETTRLLLAARGTSEARFGGPDGPLGRYYMGHVIGEIADIVFDDETSVDAFDFRIDAHGSYTRRRVTASLETQLEHRLLNASYYPIVPPVADARHGSAILSMVYMALLFRPLGNRLVAEAIRARHVPAHPGSLLPHLRNLATGFPASLAFAVEFLRRRYGGGTRIPGFFVRNKARRYGWSYHAEQAPNRDSRVWLSGKRDRLGLPQLTVDLRFSDADADSVVRTHDLMEGWLARTGIGRIEYRVPREERHAAVLALAAHGTHQIGLARMGAHRRDGVVDSQLSCFDAPNLYLASTAVLPTSGQANPTVSTVAMALRLADRLAVRLAAPAAVTVGRASHQANDPEGHHEIG